MQFGSRNPVFQESEWLLFLPIHVSHLQLKQQRRHKDNKSAKNITEMSEIRL